MRERAVARDLRRLEELAGAKRDWLEEAVSVRRIEDLKISR